MKPYNPPGRVQRPSPAWPEFRPTPSPEDLARADAAVRALGAAPPPPPSALRQRYYAQTPDGLQVTTRSNRPLDTVLEVLDHKAKCSESGAFDANIRFPGSTATHLVPAQDREHDARGLWVPHDADPRLGQEVLGDPHHFIDHAPAYAAHRYSPQSALLSTRVPTFLSYVHQKTTSRSTVCDTVMTLRIFMELVGDKRVCDITTDDTDRFLQALSVWPVHASKRREFRLMRAPEVVNKARLLRTASLTTRTQQKHIDRLRMFFRWLELRHEIRPDLLLGIRLYKRGQDFGLHREPFSESDLQLIFDVHRQTRFETPYMFWAPLLALYQGLRVNELAQLYMDDVQQIGGRWCLDITRDRPGQRLKNQHSRRCIPLHPILIECGFLDFVQQARAWRRTTLFPSVVWGINGPGDCVGDWFNRTFLRKRCGITKKNRTFHSFRHCFATFGERSKVPDARLALMLGHSAGNSVLRIHYVKLASPADFSADLNAIVFPKHEHPKYVPEAYEKAFARADVEETRQARISSAYSGKPDEQRRLR